MNSIELLRKLKQLANLYNCPNRVEVAHGYFYFDFANRGADAGVLVSDCVMNLANLGILADEIDVSENTPHCLRVRFKQPTESLR